ncbi:GDSL-type esterase/lipase family protein [Nocardia cyriacigeorgica]|uniref:GDSL-type esterase/lipase family protein n=1 Tax=Nocardia cyriacigeorgica TaxID=135487 RepID=UPI001E505284|nr:GDSL-type esterase/lipase family protein [Nocardia cyriacigeorgica]
MRKWWTAVGVAVLAGSLSTGVTVAPAGAAACGDSPWVGSWMAAPSDSFGAADPSLIPQLSVSNQTYRVVITPHRGGSVVRIHLTNRTRPVPMEVGHVTVAPQTTGGSVRAEALREVTFGGRREVSIPAWGDVVSDPVEVDVAAFAPLSVSVHVPGLAVLPTEHFNGNATSYYSLPFAGDRTTDPGGAQLPLTTTSVPLVSALDVQAGPEVATVVAFGDSITDGYVSANLLGTPQDRGVVDRNVRYPDFLQRRIDAAGLPFSVLNAGISGNRVTRDGFIPQFGPNAGARLQQDVIDKAGVTDVIILEGINDLGIPIGASYDEVVAGYTRLIERLHAAGLAVHLGTILPADNALADGVLTLPYADPVRQRINAWIRTQQLSDSVIDFDAALRDPARPNVLDPRFAGPDNLHPSAAGYQAMAEAVDIDAFVGCRN